MSKGGRKAKRTRAEREEEERERREAQILKRKEEFARQFEYLRFSSAARDSSFDTGKELYSYSDSRAFAELSENEGKNAWKKPAGFSLILICAFMIVWFCFSLIYRLCTEAEKGKVVLSMLPPLLVVAVFTAILLISVFGKWGKFLRFAFRHNLVRGHDAAERRRLAELYEDCVRADGNKPMETAFFVHERAVVLLLGGNRYVFAREDTSLRVKLENGALLLDFTLGGISLDFPYALPKGEYVRLKRALRERMSTEREAGSGKTYDRYGKRTYGGYSLGSVCAGAFFATLILVAACLMIAAHYLWLPSLPPFVGIFFIGAAGLAFCNTFHHIPAVNDVLLPLIFGLLILIMPLWAYAWIERTVYDNPLTVAYFFTHCTTFGAAATFFAAIGVYVLCFVFGRIVDYVRFGKADKN